MIRSTFKANSPFKAFLCFNLFVGTAGLYWNWTEKGETFDRHVSTLFGLRIPQFLRNISVCDESCQASQRSSLVSFYGNTNGPKWVKRKNWNSDRFYCDCEGVLCYNRTRHILAINLQGNNGMRGHVGDTLGKLPYLLGVDMGGSELQGHVSKLLATFKTFFLRFDFANNEISGEFPRQITTRWNKLGKIQLSGNKGINGTIPGDIHLLTDLQVLSLGETGITGSIPKTIANLSKLYFLDLETLSLTGDLNDLEGLSKLRYIHLMANRIRGEIPKDFGYWFPDLFELILQGNQLIGTVPASLGNLRKLSMMQLSGNKQLTGRLPLSFANLTELEILDVSDTQIQGFEKGLILQSPKLSSFVAKRNKKFTESIYDLVAALGKSKDSLIQLDVQECDIYGKFDKINDDTNLINGIFKFSKLAFLNLGGNARLNGSIPDPIGSIGLIMFFNASHTNMSAALPVAYLIKLKVLQQIDIRENPNMMGVIDESFMLVDHTLMITESPRDNFKCPTMRLRHNNCIVKMDSMYYERRFCGCNAGFYGQGGFCRKCMEGGVCTGQTNRIRLITNETNSAEVFVATGMRLKRGYWPFPTYQNVSELIKCHWTLPGKEVCNPSGLVSCHAKKESKRLITHCITDKEYICADGAYGRLCSRCKEGYYGNGLHCYQCPEKKDKSKLVSTIILAVVMIVLIGLSFLAYAQDRRIFAAAFAIFEAVATFVLAILGIIPSWLAEANILIFLFAIAGFGKFGKGILKTTVFYIQLVDALITSSHIWPSVIYSFADIVGSLINLRFSILGCDLPNVFTPVGKLLLLIILPASVSVLLATVSFLFYATASSKWPDTYNTLKYKCAHLSILFLNLSYFPLVKATFSVLVPCRRVGNTSFMANYAWIDCHGDDYELIHSLAIVSVLLYVIGVPVLFLGLLRWQKGQVIAGNQSTQQWLGSLYMPYRPQYRVTMEFWLMLRRTALAFFTTFFSQDKALQTTLISFVFLVFLTIESHAKPFSSASFAGENQGQDGTRFGLENIVEVAMLAVLLASFVAVQSSIQAENVDQKLLWGVIALNALFSICLLVCFLARVFKKEPVYDHVPEGEPVDAVQAPQPH